MEVLGVRIDEYDKKQALEIVADFLNSEKQRMIFTPNPEMLVDAQKDECFKEVLNEGDLNICDGRGIQFVSNQKLARISGADFMLDICRLAEEQGRGIYLLGCGDDEVLEKTANELKKKFPCLKIVGRDKGPIITKKVENSRLINGIDDEENNELVAVITMSAPDVLFVAFGHSKQEKWIYENLAHIPSVRIAMGVGGSFDYISGRIKRAPALFRKIGLEWLWRLVREPWRVKRIWKATVVFLVLNIFGKKNQ